MNEKTNQKIMLIMEKIQQKKKKKTVVLPFFGSLSLFQEVVLTHNCCTFKLFYHFLKYERRKKI